MKRLHTILFLLLCLTGCTQDPITINGAGPPIHINGGGPSIDINGVYDNTFLQWEEIGPQIQFYNSLKGIRKLIGEANGYAETNSAWAKQPFRAGDKLVMKVSADPAKALWVYLDADKYSFSASDVTFYDFAVVLGNASSANAHAYDGTGSIGSNTAIAAGNLIRINYQLSGVVIFEKSTDAGVNWTTFQTSLQSPAATLYAGVKIFHAEGGVDEIYKNLPVAYTYTTPLAAKKGVTIGNSTVGTYGATTEPIAYFMHTAPEWNAGYFTDNIAVSGHTIATQTTAWNNYTEKADKDWIFIMLGHNNLATGSSAATILSDFQTFINLINSTKKVGAKIIVASILPCRAQLIVSHGESLGETYYQKLLAINTGFASLTGIDYNLTAHYVALGNGTPNLAAAYDIGDGLHENNLGRYTVSRYIRTALAALNLIVL